MTLDTSHCLVATKEPHLRDVDATRDPSSPPTLQPTSCCRRNGWADRSNASLSARKTSASAWKQGWQSTVGRWLDFSDNLLFCSPFAHLHLCNLASGVIGRADGGRGELKSLPTRWTHAGDKSWHKLSCDRFFLLCFCPPPDLPASADTVGLTNVPAAAFVVRVSSETSNRFRLSPVIIREVMRSAVSAVSHLNETAASSGQS